MVFQLFSCHLQYRSMRSLYTNFIYTLRRGPSTWIILMSGSCSRKVSWIHSCIWKAETLGILGSKMHTMVFCLSLVLRYTALFNPLHSYVTPPGTTTNTSSPELALRRTSTHRHDSKMTEPATFRYVAQHLNHCATAVPHNIYTTWHEILLTLQSVCTPKYTVQYNTSFNILILHFYIYMHWLNIDKFTGRVLFGPILPQTLVYTTQKI